MPRHTFRSDNCAGLCPEAINALIDANDGAHAPSYGDDHCTAEAVGALRELFGDDTSVFFVATGTAANTLALASLTEPWQRILCHRNSHLNWDESTGPERLTGCRVVAIETDKTKLNVANLERSCLVPRGDVHHPQPGVLTISNPTELGAVYTAEEILELCEAAHALGYRVHVDGARFANAVAHLGCDPRAISREAGVDAVSFGGTKNGLAFGEAVLFFPQGDGADYARATAVFEYHRKATGHLLSKHRFMTAPFAATLRDDIWLHHARHANEMAAHLSRGLADAGIEIRHPTEANGVFAMLPAAVHRHLRARGHEYYFFGDSEGNPARLMCSFDTRPDEVAAFITDARPG